MVLMAAFILSKVASVKLCSSDSRSAFTQIALAVLVVPCPMQPPMADGSPSFSNAS
jgi:hypothetical protein